MKFSQNKVADREVRKYLEVIKEEILNRIPNIKSIILSGGFGRGEGSVEMVGNKAIPLNDLDMYIISNDFIKEEVLNEVANKAVKRLGLKNIGIDFYEFDREVYSNTFYIDLKNLTIDKLKKLPPTIRYFELKNSSCVIYGDDYRNFIPDYKIEDLPLTEGFRHLLNRMALLAEYFSTDYFFKITENEKRGLLYLGWNKAFLACAEALLILNKKFVPSYKERSDILIECFNTDFPKLSKRIPDFPEKLKIAIDFKLNPKFPKKIDPFEFWFEACYYLGEVTKYFVSEFSKKEIKTYPELSKVIYNDLNTLYYGPYVQWYLKTKFKLNLGQKFPAFLVNYYMKLIFYFRLKKFRKINHINILKNKSGLDLTLYAVLPLLLYSIDKDKKINKKMLKEAGVLINKIFPANYKIRDSRALWNEIDSKFSQAYIMYCFLKIV